MKKKILYIFASILGIGIIVLVLLVTLSRRQSSGPVHNAHISLVPTRTLPIDASDVSIFIGGVRVRDFTKTPQRILSNGHLLVTDPGTYQLFYYPESQSFLISILSSPFETVRRQAEQEFLRKLDISQQDACQLKASMTTPAFANPQEAGKMYRLSFCS